MSEEGGGSDPGFRLIYDYDDRGQVLPKSAVVLAVHEDWGGDGAGNGETPTTPPPLLLLLHVLLLYGE